MDPITVADAAYFAGLFDGEGSVYYKKTKQKKHKRPGKPIHNVWVIRMEIAMTDKDTIKWCHDLFECGAFSERKVEKDFLDEAEREKKELEESYKESLRQTKERSPWQEG